MEDYLLSEAAEACGIHRNTVLNYIRRGLVECHRDGNNYRRLPEVEVKKLMLILSGDIKKESVK